MLSVCFMHGGCYDLAYIISFNKTFLLFQVHMTGNFRFNSKDKILFVETVVFPKRFFFLIEMVRMFFYFACCVLVGVVWDLAFYRKRTSRQRSGKGAIRKRFPLQKPRWEKTKLTIRYLYHENIS